MTSQRSASGRFTRAIKQQNLFGAESGSLSGGALARPRRARDDDVEAGGVPVALAALAALGAGDTSAIDVLRASLWRVRPTMVATIS